MFHILKKHYRIAAGLGLALLVVGCLWLWHKKPKFIALIYHSNIKQSKGNIHHTPVWPEREARLEAPALETIQKNSLPLLHHRPGKRRIYIDAGHGAPGNVGAQSCFCANEQDFTLRAAMGLAARLEKMSIFEIKLSRKNDQLINYSDRIEEAKQWKAEAIISLHSDVRGRISRWSPIFGLDCSINLDSPGFSVLWSDEGEADLVAQRLDLSRSVAKQMKGAGFLAYLGEQYTGLYEMDQREPGVFVDRHLPGQRIFMLRKPAIPAILIETHHALDPREAIRWEESETWDAFAGALASALIEFFIHSMNADAGVPSDEAP